MRKIVMLAIVSLLATGGTVVIAEVAMSQQKPACDDYRCG